MSNGGQPLSDTLRTEDAAILEQLLAQEPEGRPAAASPIPQEGFLSRLGSFLGEPQETQAGNMNFLQALGLGLQDVSRGLRGEQLVLPQMSQRRQEFAQQEQRFEKELSSKFALLQKQQEHERSMRSFDRAVDLFLSDDPDKAEIGLSQLEQHKDTLAAAGLPIDAQNIDRVRESLKLLREHKITGLQLATEEKRLQTNLAKLKNAAASKKPEERTEEDNIVLGLQQPPSAGQVALAKIIKNLPPDQAKTLAMAAYGNLSGDALIWVMGLAKGMTFEQVAKLLKGVDEGEGLKVLATIYAVLSPHLSKEQREQLDPLILGKAAELAGIKAPPGGFGSKEKRGSNLAEILRELGKKLEGATPGP